MIKYKVNGVQTTVRLGKFPDGCVSVNINSGSQAPDFFVTSVAVTLIFGSEGFSINDDIIALAFVKSTLRNQYPVANIHLHMPYTPYARQDRACNPGEAHQLKDIGKMINDMNFATVSVVDPHSIATLACFERLHVIDQYEVFNGIRQSFRETYIVAPDAGATKKCEDFAKRVSAAGVITCSKTRDFANNSKITGLRVLDHVPENADLLVLDDLCDAGGTFIGLAQELRKHNPARLDLAVTHGLFTKGVGVVKDHYDKIFTTDSYISDKTGAILIDCGY